jgi:hypothetical protein
VAGSGSSQEQLDVMTKLSAVIDKIAASQQKVEESYASQAKIVADLSSQLNGVETDQSKTAIDSLNEALEASSKKSKSAHDTLMDAQKAADGMGKGAKSLTQQLGDLAKKSVVVAGAISGFKQGLRNVSALFTSITGLAVGLVDAFFNIGAAIVAIPFKLLGRLVSMASQGGDNSYMREIEALRKQFGSLAGPTNKTIINLSSTMKGFSDTGLSTWRVFGNLADRLLLLRETATAMGPVFNKFNSEFAANGGAILGYQKGLGLTDEAMKTLGEYSIATGQSMGGVMKDTTKYSLEMAKGFGLNAKEISRDMGKALGDVQHFAGATVKQIAEASVYARKLGVDLDKITKTLDTFETFDSAAESAAKLSQSFGITVDAFKLMEAQSPAEQVDMLKQAMTAAGKSADNMSRQELKLLAQTSGLDEATAKMVFSSKNQGVSLDEVKKKSAEAEKKTLTQAQAMSKLADAIERLTPSGGGIGSSFFDAFTNGISRGFQSSKEFWTMIMNINRSLMATYQAGIRLGAAIMKMFPGMSEFFTGLGAFFDPAKFSSLTNKVTDVFIKWMADLQDPNSKSSFANLMDGLQKAFFNFFNLEAPEANKMLTGISAILKTVSRIFGEGMKWVADQVAPGIKWVADIVSGKISLSSIGATGSAGLGFLGQLFAPIIDAVIHSWKVLWPPILELLTALGSRLYKWLTTDFLTMLAPFAPYIALVLFGPAMAQAALGALTASLAGGVMKWLGGAGTKLFQELGGKAAEVAGAAAKIPTGAGATGGINAAGEINSAVGTAVNADKGKSWGVKDAAQLGFKLFAIAIALSAGGIVMAGAVIAMKKILDSGGIKEIKDIEVPLLVFAGMAVASLPLALAASLLAKAGDPRNIAIGGAILAALTAVMGLVGAGLALALTRFDPTKLQAAGKFMVDFAVVFLAAVPLVFAAAAIGVAMAATGSVGMLAVAAGMVALVAVVGSMAAAAAGIVSQLNSMAITPDFQTKIDAFVSVMKSIQAFAKIFVDLVALTQPTLVEFLSGKVEKFSTKINSVTALVKSMIGTKGSGEGIIGITETVVNAIKDLAAPGLAESAKVFSDVMSGVTAAVTAMTPPPRFYESQNTFVSLLKDNPPDIGAQTASYISGMQASLTLVVEQIKGMITSFASSPAPDIEKAKAVGSLITGIGDLMKALLPTPEAMAGLSSTTETAGGWFTSASKTVTTDLPAATDFMKTYLEGMSKVIPVLTDSVINGIVKQASGLKENAEAVKVVGDILSVVTNIIKVISDAGKTGTTNIATVNPGAIVNITNQLPDLSASLDAVSTSLPGLLQSLNNMIRNVSTDKSFIEELKVAKDMFMLLGEAAKLQSSIPNVAAGTATNVSGLQAAITNISQYSEAFTTLKTQLGNQAIAGGLGALQGMIKSANDLNKALGDSLNINLDAKLQPIAKGLGVGGQYNYQIESKGIVMNVTLNVEINAADMEKAIVLRANSFVRQRLDALAETAGMKPPVAMRFANTYDQSQSGVQTLKKT